MQKVLNTVLGVLKQEDRCRYRQIVEWSLCLMLSPDCTCQ